MTALDAVVIGGGPGGYVAAIRLAQLGKKTALVEKENLGGICLNVGCIPSKALIHAASMYSKLKNDVAEMGIFAKDVTFDLNVMQTWKKEVVKKLTQGVAQLLKMNGVEVFKGEASFIDSASVEIKNNEQKKILKSNHFVIATGSRSVAIPSLTFNGRTIISSNEALELTKLPKRLVVVGGGFIGIEIGFVYAKLGSEVTILEALPHILPNTERDLVQVVEKRMRKLGMKVITQAKVLKASEVGKMGFIRVEYDSSDSKKNEIEADVVLVSIGRRPNSDGLNLEKLGIALDEKGNIITDSQGRTSISHIFAIGDVNGSPQLAHRASMDGIIAAHAINGEKYFRDYKTVPSSIFCDPEIASCGLTENEAIKKGIKFRVGKFPFVASGRALSTKETDGFIKVLLKEDDKSILGVHIVGHDASTLIAEATLAIEMGATAEDIYRTIHTHPTLPEAFPEAVEAAYLRAIHTGKPLSNIKHEAPSSR